MGGEMKLSMKNNPEFEEFVVDIGKVHIGYFYD
jgi:hypothetical protein